MRILLILSFAIFSVFGTNAQNNAPLDPVKWFYVAQKTADGEYNLLITANIEKKWNIYSQYLASNDGPVATSFSFVKDNIVELVGKTTEDGHKKEGFDEMFGMNVVKFTDKVVFTQKVKVKKGAKSIKGVVNYMCCDNEMCLPPKDVNFEIQL